MKLFYKTTLFVIILLIGKVTFAQKIAISTWEGKIIGIPIILKIKLDEATKKQVAEFDSPSQGAFGIPITDLNITKDSLSAFAGSMGGGFKGKFSADHNSVEGTWSQGGQQLAVKLAKVANKEEMKRPQTPISPFPYEERKVIYYNKDKTIKYGATLTLPKSSNLVPVVILISGSGQEDRDETIFGHKPFWILADYLSRNGIAVLRVDDRGVGESTGDVANATSLDFASDVVQSIDFVKSQKEIDTKHIGLIGHSEGGVIAPLVAIQSKDVNFIVSLAGVGVKGVDLLKKQTQDAYKQIGFSNDDLNRFASLTDLMSKLTAEYVNDEKLAADFQDQFENWRKKQPEEFLIRAKLKGSGSNELIGQMAARFFTPWMRYFLNYDPATTLGRLKIPVLALNGEKDIQVAAKENLAGFNTYLTLAGNKNFKTLLLPNLNHLFQTANTGAINEYATIEETFNVEALKIIAEWINGQVKK